MSFRRNPGQDLPDLPLREGERLLGMWRPQLALFLQRAVLLSFATALVLASLGYLSLVQWLIAVPVFTLLFMVVFDDFSVWFSHRNEIWWLTDQRLIFEPTDDVTETTSVGLERIVWTRPWFWWALQIGFDDGMSVVMRYVARPRAIGARIEKAQERFGNG
ncbi:hypothetical protein [Rhodalgimonas zhirmunskyi]|uniref:Uncharacterized protein n=1 Tax=Rhodalgimonas zhirmunskyi TaxID=2964767 RepID=A0AAJ1U649_9RHOB|nr:hypothetical protein [Rhodoalgimonas zhirmunskyi]MDQ2093830.1 hypothetical protein [Rhodoalgimonas zhirmunskyi]